MTYDGAAMPGREPLTFAAVGDVHGEMHAMVRLLAGRPSTGSGRALDFVLQVDASSRTGTRTISPPWRRHRSTPEARRLRRLPPRGRRVSVAGVVHRRQPRAVRFPRSDAARRPGRRAGAPISAGWAAIEIARLRVVGLSGIHDEDVYPTGGRPWRRSARRPLESYDRLHRGRGAARPPSLGPADVTLLHDWPEGLVAGDSFDRRSRRQCAIARCGNAPGADARRATPAQARALRALAPPTPRRRSSSPARAWPWAAWRAC